MEFLSHAGSNGSGIVGLCSRLSSYGYGHSNRRTHANTGTIEH